MKTVAIIGAGPAGLIAARKLLQSDSFSITIFERLNDVGGVWGSAGIVNPSMRTNQSRYLMSFSDFSWESLLPAEEGIRLYPKATEVYKYLKAYYNRYIPEAVIRFQTQVERVERMVSQAGDNSHGDWKLSLRERLSDRDERSYAMTFNYVVVAPGCYQVPKPLQCAFENDVLNQDVVPLLHSTKYRDLNDLRLAPQPKLKYKRRVLVVGGSHSGSDIASLLALQISDALHSPRSPIESTSHWGDVEIVHVTSHEMFALPAVVRDPSASRCTFKPLDLDLFNRSSRPAVPPPVFTFGLATAEKAKMVAKVIAGILNGDEGCFNVGQADDWVPVGVLSETYTQFVHAGVIRQVRGTLTSLKSSNAGATLAATLKSNTSQEQQTLDDICAIIYATGFHTPSSFSFLSPQVRESLSFDESCPQAPLVLDQGYLSRNSCCPSFAVLGFPGTLWGLFEMQARSIVEAWTTIAEPLQTSELDKEHDKLLEYYKDLREAVKQTHRSKVPQNPFGDGVGLLEQAYRELRLDRLDLGCSETQGFVCPSRYLDPEADKSEALKTLLALQRMLKQGREEGTLLARAVFHGLLGSWVAVGQDGEGSFTLIQKDFFPRHPTSPEYDWEYLAVDSKNGETQSTVYRYEERTDLMTVWSTLVDKVTCGTLVASFDFNHKDCEHGKDTAVAILSLPDGLDSDNCERYRFLFTGASLKMFTRLYTAKTVKSQSHFVRIGGKV